ncbi:hypothetical protein LINPERPRIM_LOCUS37700 [Linum perenne]
MMSRRYTVDNSQPQVNKEQSAKSVHEETKSDDSNFFISHQVPPVHRGNPPPSSFPKSQSQIGGPSSRTHAKVTGCTTTSILDKL